MKLRTVLRNWRVFHAADFRQMMTSPNRKPFRRQAFEIVNLLWRYRRIPSQYLHEGLFLRTSAPDWRDHMPPAYIRRLRRDLNPSSAYITALDKQRFRVRMEEAGLPVVREILTVDHAGVIRADDGTLLDVDSAAILLTEGEFFAKPIDGIHGRYAKVLRPDDDVANYLMTARNVIVQPRIRQHSLMRKLNPYAVNTVRIDTLWDGERWINNTAVLRVGSGNSIVDNGAAGGIMVGINLESGVLYPVGRKKPKFGDSVHERHPDTGVVFRDFALPHWSLLRDTVARGAEAMLPLKSLGWDVAITQDGVVLIETNHNWDVNVAQGGWGGLINTPIGRMACEMHGIRCGDSDALKNSSSRPRLA